MKSSEKTRLRLPIHLDDKNKQVSPFPRPLASHLNNDLNTAKQRGLFPNTCIMQPVIKTSFELYTCYVDVTAAHDHHKRDTSSSHPRPDSTECFVLIEKLYRCLYVWSRKNIK